MDEVRESVVLIDTGSGAGSGFVVDATGYILTNEHVVRGSTWVTVILDSGARLTAYVAATDPSRDIALIKVDRRFNSVLQFATEARVGEEVIALGYPLGYRLGESMTTTTGIVSAFRTFPNGVAYIQTDTDINFGNSGGPLLNLQGEVVGMNTSILRDEDAQGINFAIRHNVLASRLPVLLRAATTPPSATPNPTPTPTPTPGSGPQPIFGPVNGEIEHNPDDGLIDDYHARGVRIRDGVIEADFYNPYSASVGQWSSGFLFRHSPNNDGTNKFHSVVITEDGYLHHNLRTSGPDNTQRVAREYVSQIDTQASARNHIRIVFTGGAGKLYINGHYITHLQLHGLMEAGNVFAVGSYFTGHGVAGYSTRFENFTISPAPNTLFGPADGEIEHNPDDSRIDAYYSGTSIRDGTIEAYFHNPYSTSVGEWSYGFMFRLKGNSFHAVVLQSSGHFQHLKRIDGDSQQLDVKQVSEINTAYPSGNYMRLVADGEGGKLYVNGHHIADLQLQGLMDEGYVYAVGSYFKGDAVTGYATRFEDFTIWPLTP